MTIFQEFQVDRRRLAIAGLFCLGLWPIILMAHHVRSNWIPIPIMDEWHTPASQFESWYRGTLTIRELFSQHNESRKFFPRLLYFALAATRGGWDVRKEMTVFFLQACLFAVLLWRLLRQAPGSTPLAALVTWVAMMFLCFSPVQFENFLYGIQLEQLFVGMAVAAVAAVNLSALSFRAKTLANLLFALVSTYTFANGMVLWLLAVPLAAPSDSTPRRRRLLWSSVYLLTATIAISCYFVGYEKPSYHPKLASLQHQGLDLAHYLILWIGSYFASDQIKPFIAGVVAVGLATVLGGTTLILALRTKEWRAFYPWWLIGAYAIVTGIVTAFGRLGFGLQQALDSRYTIFSLFFFLALVGGSFALYCTHIRNGSRVARTSFLIHVVGLFALAALAWFWCYQKNLVLLRAHREYRVRLTEALEWMDVIPDNPDLALILPFVDVLKNRARFLAINRVLRLPFIKEPFASKVRQPPPDANGSAGHIENGSFYGDGSLVITGWAWLPDRNRRADYVVIGCKDAAGGFKPVCVLRTGVLRKDLLEHFHIPKMDRAGFARAINPANLPPGDLTIEGWAVDLKEQRAWPLLSTLHLKKPG